MTTDSFTKSHKTWKCYKSKIFVSTLLPGGQEIVICFPSQYSLQQCIASSGNECCILFLDNENILAMDDFCHINAELQGNTVLPCRPTSPDIKITLFKDERKVSSKWHFTSELNIS
jgi:histidinol-phosphate/aromatic aminotransferase/cobyric acid decarboxylase-like protein